jgi:hypothetical protein
VPTRSRPGNASIDDIFKQGTLRLARNQFYRRPLNELDLCQKLRFEPHRVLICARASVNLGGVSSLTG